MLASVSGCQHHAPAARSHATTIPFEITPVIHPGDPAPHPLYLIQLDAYQMDVPFGAVSGNPLFWSRIDQKNVASQAAALLDRNGFRIGEGATSDWKFFKQILEKNPAHTQASSRVAYQEQRELFLTRADQPGRDLFYFDSSGQLVGKSFGPSDDLLMLSFWPTPRHNGEVHIRLTPAIRSRAEEFQRQQIDGQEMVAPVRPEFFYNLTLDADIDVNHFLIVAPSEAAKISTSLGGTFLINKTSGNEKETVLIFAARPIGAPALVQTQK